MKNAPLAAARARADVGRRSVGKTTVRAPMDALVEIQFVSPGDYVKVGDPLFQLVSGHRLRAHLPFPESAAPRQQKGQPVTLTSPQFTTDSCRGGRSRGCATLWNANCSSQEIAQPSWFEPCACYPSEN